MNTPLTFNQFQAMNAARCEGAFHHKLNPPNAHWPVQNWALAIAGETGELCNLMKKVLRGDFPLAQVRAEMLFELADIITYADLMISALGGNTETEVVSKFQVVNRRVGWMMDPPPTGTTSVTVISGVPD